MGIHNRLVALAKAGNIDLYFEGDSITDYWGRNTIAQPYRANFDKYFGGWKAADFGVAADRTENVLWRITNGELDDVKPKVIVLLAGTNNVGAGATAEDITAGIQAVLRTMQTKAPDATIILTAIFPRHDRPQYMAVIDAANASSPARRSAGLALATTAITVVKGRPGGSGFCHTVAMRVEG